MLKKKWVKRIAALLLGTPLLLFLVATLFVNISPEFGGTPNTMDKARYARSPNYHAGRFENLVPTLMSMTAGQMMSTMVEFIKGAPGRVPQHKLPVLRTDTAALVGLDEDARLIWFGHSAFLLRIDGKNILIDPMFGAVPAPHPWLGKARFTEGLPMAIDDLPKIDAILISHDHYDHLDHGSIKALSARTREFFVPLGVGAHLRAWGVQEERIHELDWWDETIFEGLDLAFAPARHFSGRGINDRFATLWGSWVIRGRDQNIFFSGDSGYGPHFKDIGGRFGPFDLALMECGQYNEKWAQIHMMPEETAQAAVDVNALSMMPIHWGAFALAMHTWTDPVERVTRRAGELGMPILTPMIGEVIVPGGGPPPLDRWWVSLK